MKTYLQKGNNSLFILNHRTSKKVLVNSIILLEGNINYTTVYLDNGKRKVIAHSIKFFEPFLETHGFLRVHRSFLINPIHILNYQKADERLIMTNGLSASISRRRQKINNFTNINKMDCDFSETISFH
jgi:DNA-binding LytR/AlgR family response regulator